MEYCDGTGVLLHVDECECPEHDDDPRETFGLIGGHLLTCDRDERDGGICDCADLIEATR